MKEGSSELLYILLFVVVVLGQYVIQWLRRDREAPDDEQQEAPGQVQDMAQAELPPASTPAPAPLSPHSHADAPAYESSPRRPAATQRSLSRSPKRYSRAALFHGKRRTQDAVVAAVILGPCRALQPPDNGQ